MNSFNFSRRRFLKQSGLGLLGISAFPSLVRAAANMDMGNMNMGGVTGYSAMFPKIMPNKASPNFKPDVELQILCQSTKSAILKGKKTATLNYQVKLIKGTKETVTTIPHSFLGSIIRLHKGQKVRIYLQNGLNEPTITHWHGLHVPSNMDGHPQYAIEAGETFVYEFEVLNRAGLNIYHPHPEGNTAKQFYSGMAGALIVNDEEETALELPSGKYESLLVIQDKQFDSNNQLMYMPSMVEKMAGIYGDNILVNGRPNFRLNVDSRAYRLRIINASTARIYKLAWDDGTPMTVIGVDGGLLEHPEVKPYVMLAPAERLDVWVDFSGRKVGSKAILRSLPFTGAMPQMSGMATDGKLPVGSDFAIGSFHIKTKVSDSPKLPTSLSKITRYQISDTANPVSPLPIGISETETAMLLNSRPYEFNKPLSFERIKLNSIQLLEIFHADATTSNMSSMPGMTMANTMMMPHPIHIHGQSFQIISRMMEGDETDYNTIKDGLINSGLKDTVLVMPMERVQIIKPFQDFAGQFLYHCHNL